MKILACVLMLCLFNVLFAATYQVTLITPSGVATIYIPDDVNILDAAEEAGLDLPYSARDGTDSTAAGFLEKGTVEHIVDKNKKIFLNDNQIKNGFILTDVAYPTSNCVIKTHEEGNLY